MACIETKISLLTQFCLFISNYIQFQAQKPQFHDFWPSGCWDIDRWKHKSMVASCSSHFGRPITLTPNSDILKSLVSVYNLSCWKPNMPQIMKLAILGFRPINFFLTFFSVPYPPYFGLIFGPQQSSWHQHKCNFPLIWPSEIHNIACHVQKLSAKGKQLIHNGSATRRWELHKVLAAKCPVRTPKTWKCWYFLTKIATKYQNYGFFGTNLLNTTN